MVLQTQESKDKLNLLIDKYGRDAVNESIKKFGVDKFQQSLETTDVNSKISETNDNTPEISNTDIAPKQETVESNKPADFGSGAFLTKDVTGNPTENKAKDFGSGSLLPTDVTGNNTNITNTYEQPTQIEQPIQPTQTVEQKQETTQPEQPAEQKPEELKGGLKKYKGAGADTIFKGLRTKDLTVGSEQWNKLIEANGGEETPAMVEARKNYEIQTKLDITNKDNKAILNQDESKTKVDETQEAIDELDKSYTSYLKKIFGAKDTAYQEYKNGNEVVNDLRQDLEDKSEALDNLNDAKRDIMDDIKKKYPNMSKTEQLVLYNERVESIDDQIYTITKEYNSVLGDYKYETQKVQYDYTAAVKKADEEYKVAQDLYKTQRGDLLNEKKTEEAKLALKEERAYKEEQYQKALKDKDAEAARKFKYDIALIDYKNKVNDDFFKKFKALGNGAYATYNDDTMQWEVSKIDTSADKTDSGISNTGTGSFNDTEIQARTNRHNNPTAFTTDIAKQAGLVEGVDYVAGDKFQGGVTAKLLKDPIETTKKVIDEIGFYTASGQPRWSYVDDIFTPGKANEEWNAMTEDERTGIIEKMYQKETDNRFENFSGFTGVNKLNDSAFQNLGRTDKEIVKNLTTGVLRGDKSLTNLNKMTSEQKQGVDVLLKKVDNIRETNPDIDDLFNLLAKGGSKLSDTEGANIQKAEIQLAIDGDTDKFVAQTRKLANDYLRDTAKVDLQSGVRSLEALSAIESSIKRIDSNKLKGMKADLQNLAGVSTKEDFEGALTKMGKFTADFVKSISGAAVTDEEYKRLSKLLPSLGDTPELALNKINSFREELSKDYTTKAKFSLGGGKIGEDNFYRLFPEFNLDRKKETKPKPTGFSNMFNSVNNTAQKYF